MLRERNWTVDINVNHFVLPLVTVVYNGLFIFRNRDFCGDVVGGGGRPPCPIL